ncbi:MAG TPA: hypothetical protein VHP58_02175 [Alphaproteobacteria bacterium]|nr:hypothetical protein [Alphaproteobacteria bacterium]
MRMMMGALMLLAPLAANAAEGHDAAGHDMAAMAMPAAGETSPTVRAEIATVGELVAGQPVSLTLTLRDQYGRPVRPNDVDIIHTKPVHLFVVDGSLSDYHHLHPVPGARDGEWVAGFTPKKTAYKAWVEVQPTGQDDQFVPVQIGGVIPHPSAIGRDNVLTATAGGLRFTLTLAMPPVAGQGTLAIVNVYDDQGVPVTSLEPIMGAYAHLVGIDGGLESLMHIHPSGAEPDGPDSRGGPVMNFQLMPRTHGMHKLFLQVVNQGRLITAAFTVGVD